MQVCEFINRALMWNFCHKKSTLFTLVCKFSNQVICYDSDHIHNGNRNLYDKRMSMSIGSSSTYKDNYKLYVSTISWTEARKTCNLMIPSSHVLDMIPTTITCRKKRNQLIEIIFHMIGSIKIDQKNAKPVFYKRNNSLQGC